MHRGSYPPYFPGDGYPRYEDEYRFNRNLFTLRREEPPMKKVKQAKDIYDGVIKVYKEFSNKTINFEEFDSKLYDLVEVDFLLETKPINPKGPSPTGMLMVYCSRCRQSGHAEFQCSGQERSDGEYATKLNYWNLLKEEVRLFTYMMELSREKRYKYLLARYEDYKTDTEFLELLLNIEKSLEKKKVYIQQTIDIKLAEIDEKRKELEIEANDLKKVYEDDEEIKRASTKRVKVYSQDNIKVLDKFSS